MNPNVRKPDESFEDYKLRLKEESKALKLRLKGDMIHVSDYMGTYYRPENEWKKDRAELRKKGRS
jgi:hypothetical protein